MAFNLAFVHAGVERMLAAGGWVTPAREIPRERSPDHDKLDELLAAHAALGRVDWSDSKSITTAQRIVNVECGGDLSVDGKTAPGSKTDKAVPACRSEIEGAITPLRAKAASAEAPKVISARNEWRVHVAAILWWLLYTFGRVLYLRNGTQREDKRSGQTISENAPEASVATAETSGPLPVFQRPTERVVYLEPPRYSYSMDEWSAECTRIGRPPDPPMKNGRPTEWRPDPKDNRVYAYPVRGVAA
jgi:hypothetical protein